MMLLVLLVAALSFMISASAGLGGSLLLVPSLCLILGPKQGIALAALLLGCNNIAKVAAYRSTIPLRAVGGVFVLTLLGAGLGARLLVKAPEFLIHAAILVSLGASFLFERKGLDRTRQRAAPVLAFLAGASSGFSGTSGPLKGIALRNLNLDRLHLVGAASVVSLAGDAIKTAIFAQASLLTSTSLLILLAALPLMPMAALAGHRLNQRIGERAYACLFWTVMTGYGMRLVFF